MKTFRTFLLASLTLGTASILATGEAHATTCQTQWYVDADRDGFGTPNASTTACTAPAGYVSNKLDCNDNKSTVNPNAKESCNAIDDNCNGSTDEGVQTTYYKDTDGDGFGTASTTKAACSKPAGYSTFSTDCDDASAAINPNAKESCNGKDDNCNKSIDEGVTITVYVDADGDKYGTSTSKQACSATAGYATKSGDCNDAKAAINPGATETCNSIDDNCNGKIDDNAGPTYYLDQDGDGYGTSTSLKACTQPTGYAALSGDCNDDPAGGIGAGVHPGQAELCNGRDEDCNGKIDDTTLTYYWDADGDGYGSEATAISLACGATPQDGYVAPAGDCNDADFDIFPSQVEVCDGIDNNCDGEVDNADLATGTSVCGTQRSLPARCAVIAKCSKREVIACDFGNPNNTPIKDDFEVIAGYCADRGASLATIRSQSDDACIAAALEPLDSQHYYAVGFNRVESGGKWDWKSGVSNFVGLTWSGITWTPSDAAPDATVMTLNVELKQGTQTPYFVWMAAPNTEFQTVLCER